MLLLICLCCFISTQTIEAKIHEVKSGAFIYEYKSLSSKTCQLTNVWVEDEKKASVLKIPSRLNGKIVVKMGSVDLYDSNIFGVFMTDENTKLHTKPLIEKSNLVKEIILPNKLRYMKPSCLENLPNLKKITIPSSLTKDVERLRDNKWISFKVAKGNKKYKVQDKLLLSKNGKELYAYVGCNRNLKVPEGVKRIRQNALAGTNAVSIYLPKTIDIIDSRALQNGRALKLSVSSKNPHYKMSEGCLYSKKSGRLVAAYTKNRKLLISSKITKLSAGTSYIGGEAREITIPGSVTVMKEYWDFNFYTDYEAGKYGRLVFLGMKPPRMDSFLASTIYVPAKAYDAYYKEVHKGPLIDNTTKIIKMK